MPAGPEGDNISTLDTLLVAMNENAKCPEAAWDFIKVLTSNTEIQSEIFDYSEGVSVLKEVTESDQTLQQLIESSGESGSMNLAVLSDAVENAVIAPGFRGYDEAVAGGRQGGGQHFGGQLQHPDGSYHLEPHDQSVLKEPEMTNVITISDKRNVKRMTYVR